MATILPKSRLDFDKLPQLDRDKDPVLRAYDMQIEALRQLHDMQADVRNTKVRPPTVDLDVVKFVEYRMCYDQGQPISFKMRPWQRDIYNSEVTVRDKETGRPKRRTLLMTARQNEKSTSLGNKILAHTTMNPNMTFLYVTSADQNMSEFVDERIDNVIRLSPHLSPYIGKFVSYSRYLKRFAGNNSKIVARSANLHADRVRGIAADGVAIDEIQNIQWSNIPVILAVVNNSPFENGPIVGLSGTPLTYDNPIQRIWANNSTQKFWMMVCPRCRHDNIAGLKQIGPMGLICEKCGRGLNPLDPTQAQWVHARGADKESDYEGYHLSRALMPYTVADKKSAFETRWAQLYRDVYKDRNATESSIYNEILGLPYDDGTKPITEAEVRRHCSDDLVMSRSLPRPVVKDPEWATFAGIDWGEGSGNGSYTVVCLGYRNADKFRISYMYRYLGREADPAFVKKDLIDLLESNKIDVVFPDAGMGWGMNDVLREELYDGESRVFPVQYSGSLREPLAFDGQKRSFVINRTRWMARFFNLIKKGRIEFPRWSASDMGGSSFGGAVGSSTGFAADLLSIYTEVTPKRDRTMYNHTAPDDAFHAILYAYTASLWMYKDLEEFIRS
jgi:hypothetical protein